VSPGKAGGLYEAPQVKSFLRFFLTQGGRWGAQHHGQANHLERRRIFCASVSMLFGMMGRGDVRVGRNLRVRWPVGCVARRSLQTQGIEIAPRREGRAGTADHSDERVASTRQDPSAPSVPPSRPATPVGDILRLTEPIRQAGILSWPNISPEAHCEHGITPLICWPDARSLKYPPAELGALIKEPLKAALPGR
jgi:hypothetical protein